MTTVETTHNKMHTLTKRGYQAIPPTIERKMKQQGKRPAVFVPRCVYRAYREGLLLRARLPYTAGKRKL
jgi:hypothetical protein